MWSMVAGLLSGCGGNNGSSAPPPTGFTATAGDGRVKLEWTPSPGVSYWIFTATDPGLNPSNWTGLPNAHGYSSVHLPFYMCGLFNATPYYFAMNGRINGGPGGSSSPTISATPYNASASAWTANPKPLSKIINGSIVSPDIYGVGYTSLTTCSNIASISSSGSFAAVGAGGAIFTSDDGINWNTYSSPLSTDLYAVTGYAAHQNNPASPDLL